MEITTDEVAGWLLGAMLDQRGGKNGVRVDSPNSSRTGSVTIHGTIDLRQIARLLKEDHGLTRNEAEA